MDEEECRVPFSPETFAFDQRLVLKPTTKFEKCTWTNVTVQKEFFKEVPKTEAARIASEIRKEEIEELNRMKMSLLHFSFVWNYCNLSKYQGGA